MVFISRRSLATTFLVLITVLIAATANADSHALKDRLSRLEQGSQKNTRAGNALEAILAFYSQRDHRPLWLEDSRLSPRAKALLNALANAADHGLNPDTYGARTLAERASRTEAAQMPELELALTLAYLSYVGDVSSGVIDNPRNRGGIARDAKRSPAAKWLEDIANADDFAMFFDRLPPDTRSYKQLRAALAKHREIEKAGGWPTVDKGPRLKPGMAGARVTQIKRRLVLTGELDTEGDAELFDDDLVVAVKKFQVRHGLEDDGNVGAETVAEMNVPVRVRIEQIVINLERHRWLGAYLGDRYIHVNVANNGLKIIENDQTIHVARAIVGKPLHETPVFSASITYIEINPYWNVPHGIAVNELLPKIKSNPGFLAANGYFLLGRSGDNSSAINPASVDWSMITPHYFPYFLRQKPGPHNALGTIAFMFPNPHNVFIHDTPGKSLFNLAERYFSHGCIRVQFPMKLAILLLAGQDGGRWNEGRIRSVVETNEQTRVELKNPIPVHITYFTAWADADGTVHFRKDPYRRDGTLKRAIEQIAQAK